MTRAAEDGVKKIIRMLAAYCCFGLLALSAQGGYAAPLERPLKVVLLPYPGYSDYDQHGRVVGPTADVLEQLFKRAGYAYQINLLPIARVRRGLVSGEVDVWLGVNNQVGLEAYVVQSESSFGALPIHLYYRADEPKRL